MPTETDRRDGIEPPAIVFVTTYSTVADKGPILQVNNNTDFKFLISFKKYHDSAIFFYYESICPCYKQKKVNI